MNKKRLPNLTNTFFVPERWLSEPVRVALVGVGGTGSELLDALARMHTALQALGHPGFEVVAWDADDVSATNLLRQRFLPGDEGLNKAEVLIQRYNVFMGLCWEARGSAFQPRDLRNTDLLITCVDKAAVRVGIAEHAKRWRTPVLWLDTGNDAHQGQVVLGHLGIPEHGLRLPNIVDLYPDMGEKAAELDAEGPSCSAEEALTRQEWPVNRQVAVSASALLWNLLRHGRLDHHGVFIDVRTGLSSPLRVDEKGWAAFGYTAAPQS